MRVIAGSARGRAIRLPSGLEIRPTSDRVREAIFDVLAHLDLIEGASVLDLFAGTGALGIEAASRGAEQVVFVDQDRAAVAAIEANLESTRVGEECSCRAVRSEALGWCRGGRERIDLALIDPPYAFSAWDELLSVVPGSFLVLESNRPLELPESLALHRSYRYGTTLVTMATRLGDGAQLEAP